MPVRTTVDIPEPLHDLLRHTAEQSGVSIRSLIVRALEQAYRRPSKSRGLSKPLVGGPGRLGPAFPKDKNPHDLVLP
ncbi:MAG: CopG family transcriptional regulator [Bryobacteraceae bacterium]|nr:CopG family transcriptional regulator [Bryobacteraceae bacterium]